jgi:multidrug resistance efflux pump
MSDYQMALQSYRADIAALEARARAVRDAWFSADHEANQYEADQLEHAARDLRQSLAQVMRDRFVGTVDDDEEEEELHRDPWFE